MGKDECDKLIATLNNTFGVSFVYSALPESCYIASYDGDVILQHKENVSLRISFPSQFPLQLPHIFVVNSNRFRLHVDSCGKICLFDTSSLLLKTNMHKQILLDCYEQAINILTINPYSDLYRDDVLRELCAYWGSADCPVIYSCIELQRVSFGKPELLMTDKCFIVASDSDMAEHIACNNQHQNKDCVMHNSIILRLKKGCDIPPIVKECKWNALRRYIEQNTTSSVRKRFAEYTKECVKEQHKILFLVVPSVYGDVLLAFDVSFANKNKMQLGKAYMAIAKPVHVIRIDQSYLTLRSGSKNSITEKQILLLGCGSVGGFIANNLCQMGANHIDILDQDMLEPENVYRHFLGFDSLQMGEFIPKADQMRRRLEAMYPYVEIDSLNFLDRSVESLLHDPARLRAYDVIISALGEPTLDLEINRVLQQHEISVPFLCCFNEPYGIGGHVAITNINRSSCLQCLYTDVISRDIVPFRGSLVEPGQNFHKYLAGCSSAFVPYSGLDSQQTAILAARTILTLWGGTLTQNTLYTWIGKDDDLVANGFKTSEYYNINKRGHEISYTILPNEHCSICAGGGATDE